MISQIICLFPFQLATRNRRKTPLKPKKRIFNENNLASFKDQLSNITQDNLSFTEFIANSLYKTFLNIFNEMYDVNFPFTEIKIKPNNFKTPWFSKGLN